MALNCARSRYRIRRGAPQTLRELRLMRAGARDRWLSTALLSPQAAYFQAQIQWYRVRKADASVTFSTHIGIG